jgi:hypothetical protein
MMAAAVLSFALLIAQGVALDTITIHGEDIHVR